MPSAHNYYWIQFHWREQSINPSIIMPKEPKNKMSSGSGTTIGHSVRHAPLGQVIQDDANRGKYATRKISLQGSGVGGGGKSKKNNARGADDEDDEEEYLDVKTSRKILDLSRDQRQEMMMEEEAAALQHLKQQQPNSKHRQKNQTTSSSMRKNYEDDSSEDDDDNDDGDEEDDDEDLMVEQDDSGYVTMSTKHIGLTPEEEALLSNMMGNNNDDEDNDLEGGGRRNLADIIMAKIQEKEAMAHRGDNMEEGHGDEEEIGMMELPPKVVQVYTDIGKLLTHYTSGKLPKAFKVIPSLHNWEEVLYLTRPDQWTPQAMYAATRIFASNLNPKMAQRFYNLVLLDAVRADIYSNKKLNYHYYMALKKSVYKPAAFFKGILLPLCKENCTLREAIIVASVLQRVSIPVHHSAVALHKLALMTEYNGATSIFIKTLLNKKYSLPAPVITSLIAHFVRFKDGEDNERLELPVLWHQALLAFVQRYKNDIDVGGKEQLRDLMKVHNHAKITVEVRRELFGSAAWREERERTSSATVVAAEDDGDSMVM
ncbi:hypothetical protein ACHAWU_009208 [Discostella pseudostelligera]|uniref:Bystin n=1 Tax=Discostella pseudostelligera TaxID=259834 RepID=A0ABD3MHW4_9STRA